MKIIGITGGIASGKSLISQKIIELGYDLIDADQLVEDFYEDDANHEFLISQFATKEKKSIREIVRNDSSKLALLEEKIHPFVRQKISDFIKEKKDMAKDLVFLDVALLYEGKLWQICDEVIYIITDIKLREERFLERKKGDLAYFKKIVDKQAKPEDIINEFKPFLLNNSFTIDDAYNRLDEILAEIKNA